MAHYLFLQKYNGNRSSGYRNKCRLAISFKMLDFELMVVHCIIFLLLNMV